MLPIKKQAQFRVNNGRGILSKLNVVEITLQTEYPLATDAIIYLPFYLSFHC